MNRFVVFVDAGYLLSQSVQALSHSKSKSRKDVTIIDAQGLVAISLPACRFRASEPALVRRRQYGLILLVSRRSQDGRLRRWVMSTRLLLTLSSNPRRLHGRLASF